MDAKAQNLVLAGGAAGTIVLPQAITSAWPQLFGAIAPVTANTLPYCTGVCGSCGGGCVGSIGALLWMGACALTKHKREANK